MSIKSNVKKGFFSLSLALALTPLAFAQDTNPNSRQTPATSSGSSATSQDSASRTSTTVSSATNSRSIASGEKAKIKGVVTRREADTFTIRDENGVETVVRLDDKTSVKTKGGFLRSGKNYGVTSILRGLSLEVEGRGDASGQLVAEKVRFNDSDLRVARSIESRVDPVENRVGTAETRIGQVEQNAQRLSGQLDELAAVANTAKGGAKAAQEAADAARVTADSAVAGVNATNSRISALDDYEAQQTASVQFKVNSAVITPEYKAQLDEIAKQALAAKGYVIEVSGFASADGSRMKNQLLSQKRADAVIRYLVETHNIPLRRIITPFGYGETNPIADNTTREGRAQNRRVEVKVLVNKGLLQQSPQMDTGAPASSSSSTPQNQ